MEEEEKKKYTLETLFYLYANSPIKYTIETDGIIHEKILLSQIDSWLEQAKLLKSVFSTTETGLTYMKFRRWRLDFEEFMEFLAHLCARKENLSAETIKKALVDAGVPEGKTEIIIVK